MIDKANFVDNWACIWRKCYYIACLICFVYVVANVQIQLMYTLALHSIHYNTLADFKLMYTLTETYQLMCTLADRPANVYISWKIS